MALATIVQPRQLVDVVIRIRIGHQSMDFRHTQRRTAIGVGLKIPAAIASSERTRRARNLG
jgi:hypothetical protein